MHPAIACLLLTLAEPPETVSSASSPLSAELDTLRAVGAEGAGNAAASAAWPRVAAARPEELILILQAMEGANELALNWLRTAFDTAAGQAGQTLPLDRLEAFLRDTSHAPRPRELAYEWLARTDTNRAEPLLTGLLQDPSSELRRLAVAREIAAADQLRDAAQPGPASERYRTALNAARAPDQIETLADRLRQLGEPVDLAQLFGWITRWKVIGPFDNTDRTGFDQAYPPEQEVDLAAEYTGKAGSVRWKDGTSAREDGLVDLNAPLGTLKEVTGYATTEFYAPVDRPAEIRLGCKNAWKLWFNGEFIFGRDEYHRAREIDQYRFPVVLRAGRNVILLKICQNEEIEDWTREWEFQLRITDRQGTPLRSERP